MHGTSRAIIDADTSTFICMHEVHGFYEQGENYKNEPLGQIIYVFFKTLL